MIHSPRVSGTFSGTLLGLVKPTPQPLPPSCVRACFKRRMSHAVTAIGSLLPLLLAFLLPAAFFLGGILSPLKAQGFETKLTASDGATNDEFGSSVSIDGDRAIIGAPGDDPCGSAYVFQWNGTAWVEEAKLTASDGAAGDQFGCSVSINGDRAVIGAYYDDDKGDRSGSAYVFKWDGTAWVEEAKLTASDGAATDCFGGFVSISGDRAVIGARFDDDNGLSSGSAYVYRWDGAAWVEEAKLTASDGAAGDQFGCS
ncbi:unnamed protein product, partial [marine sediment metagenome]